MQPIPLSLYIHLPWCIRKCPYCDFNSHVMPAQLPEAAYTTALLQELRHYLPWIIKRPLVSVFFGGGTPSLFSGAMIENILNAIATSFPLSQHTEITLEANPGTAIKARFKTYQQSGVNRLSIGIQSFHNHHLKQLGRIHNGNQAKAAVLAAQEVGLTNVNIDLMFGLPKQTIAEALEDLQHGLQLSPTHLSWYQLTIEPNTVFYRYPPPLPNEATLLHIEKKGKAYLRQQHFRQYEVSAYAKPRHTCQHNQHYWKFGDYLGLGAGAHSKLTLSTGQIIRFAQVKQPDEYLNPHKRRLLLLDHAPTIQSHALSPSTLIFEFMLNALRLTQGVPKTFFHKRTGLNPAIIQPLLKQAVQKQLLLPHPTHFHPTALGKKYLNDLIALFLQTQP